MQSNEVSQRVRNALARLEAEQNVRVLYACESGSRAWGFASRDSDYDVRFLYVHTRSVIKIVPWPGKVRAFPGFIHHDKKGTNTAAGGGFPASKFFTTLPFS